MIKMEKYKLPPEEKKKKEGEAANQSHHELLSDKSNLSDTDERAMRKKALQRIMKNLDIKNKNEELFGEKFLNDEENPAMRYSIQDRKTPFHTESESDQKRHDSEPAIKFDKTKSKDNVDKKDKSLHNLIDELQEDKDNKSEENNENMLNKEDSKSDSVSEMRRQEADYQTDDKSSEEEKKLQITGKI
jgi:hypothetical protein